MGNYTIDYTTATKIHVFTGQPRQIADLVFELDGDVAVWDDVAGHYTRCHSISDRTMTAIRRQIRAAGKCNDALVMALRGQGGRVLGRCAVCRGAINGDGSHRGS